MGNKVVQLKILLKHTKPPIWRRIVVHSEITFYELHYTIQLAMGWANNHIYEFELDNYTIGEPLEDPNDFDSNEVIDSELLTLEEVISQGKNKFDYNYDLGDFWQHSVEVEQVLPLDQYTYYPVCIKGKGNCPPEDCGGIPGFLYLLDVLKNKNHPEYKTMMEWTGGFDPLNFDLEETNFMLQNLDAFMDDQENDTDFF